MKDVFALPSNLVTLLTDVPAVNSAFYSLIHPITVESIFNDAIKHQGKAMDGLTARTMTMIYSVDKLVSINEKKIETVVTPEPEQKPEPVAEQFPAPVAGSGRKGTGGKVRSRNWRPCTAQGRFHSRGVESSLPKLASTPEIAPTKPTVPSGGFSKKRGRRYSKNTKPRLFTGKRQIENQANYLFSLHLRICSDSVLFAFLP